MKQLNLFIELTRLKRPIGYMLLFWPCAWGLTLAYDFSKNPKPTMNLRTNPSTQHDFSKTNAAQESAM